MLITLFSAILDMIFSLIDNSSCYEQIIDITKKSKDRFCTYLISILSLTSLNNLVSQKN